MCCVPCLRCTRPCCIWHEHELVGGQPRRRKMRMKCEKVWREKYSCVEWKTIFSHKVGAMMCVCVCCRSHLRMNRNPGTMRRASNRRQHYIFIFRYYFVFFSFELPPPSWNGLYTIASAIYILFYWVCPLLTASNDSNNNNNPQNVTKRKETQNSYSLLRNVCMYYVRATNYEAGINVRASVPCAISTKEKWCMHVFYSSWALKRMYYTTQYLRTDIQ